MNYNPRYFEFSHSFLLCFFLVFIFPAGCITVSSNTTEKTCQELAGSGNGGRVSIFLHAAYPGVVSKELYFTAVEVLSGDEWIPIMAEPRKVNTSQFNNGQVFLGSRIIPAGGYKLFRVVTAGALEGHTTEVVLSSPLVISSGSSNALFLKWDAADQEAPFKLDGTSQTEDVATNIAVVTCPDTGTIYFIRTDKNRIYGTLAVPGLSYIAIDNFNKRLFVLVPEEAKIKVVDLVSRTVFNEIDIPATLNPTYIVMDPEASNVYILDERGNMIRIDVKTGNMLARNRIGHQLSNAIYIADQGKLAVSAVMDRKVYFVDPADLRILEAVNTEGEPQGLMELNGRLYIVESDIDNVLVYDLNDRRMLDSIPVAANPFELASYGDNVYVSNRLDASVFLIKDGSFYLVKEVKVGVFPEAMAIDEQRKFLYVASGDCQGRLSVVDTTSNKLSGMIELGARPLDVEVVD